jgi:hypothetical protein
MDPRAYDLSQVLLYHLPSSTSLPILLRAPLSVPGALSSATPNLNPGDSAQAAIDNMVNGVMPPAQSPGALGLTLSSNPTPSGNRVVTHAAISQPAFGMTFAQIGKKPAYSDINLNNCHRERHRCRVSVQARTTLSSSDSSHLVSRRIYGSSTAVAYGFSATLRT